MTTQITHPRVQDIRTGDTGTIVMTFDRNSRVKWDDPTKRGLSEEFVGNSFLTVIDVTNVTIV